MITLEINVEPAEAMFAALNAALTDMTPVMDTLGEMMVASNQRGMDAGESPEGNLYAPRSPVTLARYQKQGKSFGLPLHVTGMLRGSIFPEASDTEVSWGTNLIQAAVMQFGAAQGAFGASMGKDKLGRDHFHHLPWGNIPARPFIGASTSDLADIVATLEEWLQGAVNQTP